MMGGNPVARGLESDRNEEKSCWIYVGVAILLVCVTMTTILLLVRSMFLTLGSTSL